MLRSAWSWWYGLTPRERDSLAANPDDDLVLYLYVNNGLKFKLAVHDWMPSPSFGARYTVVVEYAPASGYGGRSGVRSRMRSRIGGDVFYDGSTSLFDDFMSTEIRYVGSRRSVGVHAVVSCT